MSNYCWLTDASNVFLKRDYLLKGQEVDDRVNEICQAAEARLGMANFAYEFKENIKKGWYSLSSPIWTNFGNRRGNPISCFGSMIMDSIESIVETYSEVAVMTKGGGGTSAYFGNVRPRGSEITDNGETFGSVHFMQMYDNLIKIISQGSSRRGQFAAYLPIDHGDIEEFLNIRHEGNPLQSISTGVCISDEWMNKMIEGDKNNRRIWAKVLESRTNTGYPYLFFTDNVNNNAPDVYKKNGLKITHSNLCSEICLYDDEHMSFVCDLSSMNLSKYYEWKDTNAVELLVFFLDAVMSEFIEKASQKKFMDRAVRFAEKQRALGIGWIGWHSLLQELMIPFESMEAKLLNVEIIKNMHDAAYNASEKLAKLYGEPELLSGSGRRNATLLAIAPTKSSAFILGQASEAFEPHRSNYYIKDLQKGKFTIRNTSLEKLLESKNLSSNKVWTSILKSGGSVQHLDELSDYEKSVFKTFAEISPMELVVQAAQRQKFIDQSQSLNLMIHSSIPTKDINALIIEAWKLGVKTLYYQIGVSAAQNFSRNIFSCSSCEG